MKPKSKKAKIQIRTSIVRKGAEENVRTDKTSHDASKWSCTTFKPLPGELTTGIISSVISKMEEHAQMSLHMAENMVRDKQADKYVAGCIRGRTRLADYIRELKDAQGSLNQEAGKK